MSASHSTGSVSGSNGEKIEVLSGHFAPLDLYLKTERHVMERVPLLEPDKLYTLREIYGEDAWLSLGTAWVRRMAGRCFAHMVYTGRFPLVFRRYKRSVTKRYQVK